MIRATAVYLFLSLYLLTMGPVGMAWTALSGNTVFIYRLARFCIGFAGLIAGIRLKIRGLDRLQRGQTYLFLSNHQGNIDGPLLCWSSRRDLRALIKREMMRLPMLSLVLRQVQFVPVDRTDPLQARASIDEGARLLRTGLSFFAFPEGTRSRDGQLGRFKKGVFLMAIKAGVPIVPVTINHSRKIQPPGSYAIHPAEVEVVFHDPIPTETLSPEDRETLLQAARGAIASALAG